MLPYHLGVLASLEHHGAVTDSTPLAGSSAGAIAVASHASGVPPEVALDASIRISGASDPAFVARGRLLPSLRRELDALLAPDAHERLNNRAGAVGLAYRELFPENRAVLQTSFATRGSLIDAICDSSVFPFFTSNRPFRAYIPDGEPPSRRTPRVTVDGIFATPWHRCGCPEFRQSQGRGPREGRVGRTVRVLAFPHQLVDMNPVKREADIISPKLKHLDIFRQVAGTGLMAITKSRPKDLRKLYESGWEDAAEWASSNGDAI